MPADAAKARFCELFRLGLTAISEELYSELTA